MVLWDQSVEILRQSIFAYAQVCNGNLGLGILAVTFLTRLALVPLSIRISKAAMAHQQAMARLQPELDAIRLEHTDNPHRLAEETSRVLKRENVSPLPLAGCLGAVIQMPVFIALYSSVSQAARTGGRFFWIRDLARPDWVVVIAATMFTLLATATSGTTPAQNRLLMLAVSAVVTIAALSAMPAGVGLYWGLSSLFGAAQGWVVERSLRTHAA